MKTFRDKTGQFAERPYYETRDIENTCTQELRAADLFPRDPSPIRIERFIEKRFGVVPTYEELDPGILGYSKFGSRGLEAVVVSKELAEAGTQGTERRLNTTLAHEAGHALLHAHLFVLGSPQTGLFGKEVTTPKILCRDDTVHGDAGRKYDGRWWEYQANQAMGALLLPRGLVQQLLSPMLTSSGTLGIATRLPDGQRDHAITEIVRVFEVNPIVARIRLGELFPSSGQLTL